VVLLQFRLARARTRRPRTAGLHRHRRS
jgi:hypothetical protein